MNVNTHKKILLEQERTDACKIFFRRAKGEEYYTFDAQGSGEDIVRAVTFIVAEVEDALGLDTGCFGRALSSVAAGINAAKDVPELSPYEEHRYLEAAESLEGLRPEAQVAALTEMLIDALGALVSEGGR
jgi:hypothetical protein